MNEEKMRKTKTTADSSANSNVLQSIQQYFLPDDAVITTVNQSSSSLHNPPKTDIPDDHDISLVSHPIKEVAITSTNRNVHFTINDGVEKRK